MTSSAGRLFDAVAALADVRDRVSYEGQAAMELEWLATGATINGVYPFELDEGILGEGMPCGVVDTRPIIRAVARDVQQGLGPNRIARRFHSTIVEIIAAVCARIRQTRVLDTVVLSGGVFMNALLTAEVEQRLCDDGWRVYRHRLVPTNDGGLSLGQLAIAASQMSSSSQENSGTSSPERLASV
jgi:hydrogenase maturation protein HypF